MNKVFSLLDLTFNILKYLIIVHFITCLWIITSKSDGNITWYKIFILNENHYLNNAEYEVFDIDNEETIYLEALNFIISTVTTIGFGTTYAINDTEKIFALILMICSIVIYSFFIGRITNYVNELNSESKQKDEKIKHLSQIIKKFDIKASLIKKIKSHFGVKNNNIEINNKIKNFTDKLPEKLRYDINEKIMDKRLEKLLFFKKKNISMIIYISKYLFVVNYNQDDYICKINQFLKESKHFLL